MKANTDVDIKDVISINRRWYSSDTLYDAYPHVQVTKQSHLDKVKANCFCSKQRAWKFVNSFVPVIKIITKYKREYVIGDLISGLNATFLHLPQGLGFGILAGLQPVYGLYTSFFPVVIYLLFGTSPYVSFGSNAVMALLTQTIVQREADMFSLDSSGIVNGTQRNSTLAAFSSVNNTQTPNTYSPEDSVHYLLQIKVGAAMTASLLTGIVLAGLGFLRLGFLTRFMSVSFIGGFTTAAAIHIVSSQVPKMFGISVSSHSGAGRLIKMYIELFSKIETTRIAELIIAIVTMVILLFVKIMINEKYKDRMKIPIPIDFLIVVIGTIISHFAKFEQNFEVTIVGEIPSGFPIPSIPSLASTSRMLVDCVVMAILSLALTISLAKLTAKQHGIRIDDNQELIAYGFCNIGSSFFSCFPQATAPPRTMILSNLGAKTTLNAIPTSIIVLLVILWIGTLFQSLPVSILAAMIAVAMKNLLQQFGDLPRLWKINKYDCFTWIITCSVSVFADLDYGILAGIVFSIVAIIIQHYLASGSIIGYSNQEDIYIDSKDREHVIEMASVKIFQFQAPIHFANAERFKTALYRKVGNPVKMNKMTRKEISIEVGDKRIKASNGSLNIKETTEKLKHVILDFQFTGHIDLSGINILSQIVKEYKDVGVEVYLVKCSIKITETLAKANFFNNFPKENILFDISDAVYFINMSKLGEHRIDLLDTKL